MRGTCNKLLGLVAGVSVWLSVFGTASASESDFYAGLAYLRAGAQDRAVESLTKYRDEERNAEVRRSIDRILPLLKGPLSEDVREYIAANLEENVVVKPRMVAEGVRTSYRSRMFPVFP
jgi:hypothetical protein